MEYDVKHLIDRLKDLNFNLRAVKNRTNNNYKLYSNDRVLNTSAFNSFCEFIPDNELSMLAVRIGYVNILNHLEQIERENISSPTDIDDPLLKDKILISDHRAQEKDPSLVYLVNKNKISDMTSAAVRKHLSNIPADHRPHIPLTIVRLVYDPYLKSGRSIYVMDGVEIPLINLYNPPSYRLHESEEEAIPETVDIILKSLSDYHEPTYIFLLDYISSVLTKRVEYFVILVSIMEGTGKSSFARIIKKLVGDNNYMDLNHTFWDRQFNSDAKHKQFCYQDEVYIPEKKLANFKSVITEKKVGFESKGKDITLSANTASYSGSSNSYKDCSIKGPARRHCLPNITNVKLKDRLFDKDIHDIDKWMKEEFERDINDPTKLKAMYNFFMNREIVHKIECIPTKSFYVGKFENLRTQLQCALNLLLEMNGEIDFKTFKALLREEMKINSSKNIEPIRNETLNKFLIEFEWRQVSPIGEMYNLETVTPQGDVVSKIVVKSFIGKGTVFPKCVFDREGIWDVDTIKKVKEQNNFDFL